MAIYLAIYDNDMAYCDSYYDHNITIWIILLIQIVDPIVVTLVLAPSAPVVGTRCRHPESNKVQQCSRATDARTEKSISVRIVPGSVQVFL